MLLKTDANLKLETDSLRLETINATQSMKDLVRVVNESMHSKLDHFSTDFYFNVSQLHTQNNSTQTRLAMLFSALATEFVRMNDQIISINRTQNKQSSNVELAMQNMIFSLDNLNGAQNKTNLSIAEVKAFLEKQNLESQYLFWVVCLIACLLILICFVNIFFVSKCICQKCSKSVQLAHSSSDSTPTLTEAKKKISVATTHELQHAAAGAESDERNADVADESRNTDEETNF